MNNISKLEASIYKIIDEYIELRKERDNAIKDAENAKDELRKAQETINELEGNIEKVGSASYGNSNIEDKKNEIIRHIKSVINRVEKFKINDITSA